MTLINKLEINCEHFNWGGDGSQERPHYPLSYGARCEYYNDFFEQKGDKLIPDCNTCIYKNDKKRTDQNMSS